jgi:hypothetical protein
MSSVRDIHPGSRVRLVFEGDVFGVDKGTVRFRLEDGQTAATAVAWGSNVPVSVEILSPKYAPGDVGVYEGPRGGRAMVVFRAEQSGHAAGWYDVRTHFAQKVASPFNPKVRLLVRGDGSEVRQTEPAPASESAPEPKEPPSVPEYVPQLGDVALWRKLNGMPIVVQCRTWMAGSYAWYDIYSSPIGVSVASDRFELVISGGKLVAGVGVRD